MKQITRRRFIAISAFGAAGLAIGYANSKKSKVVKWQGYALGADVSITLHGNKQKAESALKAAISNLRRLEAEFSIYNPHSTLSRLNKHGEIALHKRDGQGFANLLKAVDVVHRQTQGLFDPTVQSLFDLYKKTKGRPPKQDQIRVLQQIGWNKVHTTSKKIVYTQPDMSMTLNGIAQGYITDEIKRLLAKQGFQKTLVNMGEIAVGDRLAHIGIADARGEIFEVAKLERQAIATSSSNGYHFEGGASHIIHPLQGVYQSQWDTVSVVAKEATYADGYSTALALAPNTELAEGLKRKGIVERVILKTKSGEIIKI